MRALTMSPGPARAGYQFRPSQVPAASSAASAPGSDLGPLRGQMESLFDHDFTSVRIHQDGMAEAHGARAVTLGDDIHIRPGEPSVSSPAGYWLIAHELAHVIQQRRLPGGVPRRRSELEREADEVAAVVRAGRNAKVSGQVAADGPVPQRKPKLAPPPPSGSILYVGMNNADPEVQALLGRYPSGSPVSVTVVKGTHEESATSVGGVPRYDLTTDDGVLDLALQLAPMNGWPPDLSKVMRLYNIIKSQAAADRDDLAHVVKVYADTEADGKDRMTRVVLSGHSGGSGVFGSSGEIYFSALVELADVFPHAANQAKHLIVAGCHTGDEGTIVSVYVKAYPSLLTVWAWWDTCPTGAGAAAAIETWAGLTEKPGVTKLPKEGGGIATWSGGTYQGGSSAPAFRVLDAIHGDEPRFQEYVTGAHADPGPHGGWLEAYYSRVTAAAHRTDLSAADRNEMIQKAQQALRLRFWPQIAKNFFAKFGATITKGYGSAPVPDYANLSRKNTLQAISDFPAASKATGQEKADAARLLDALKNLDPALIPESMVTE